MAKFNHIKSRTAYYCGQPRTYYGFNRYIDGVGMSRMTSVVKAEGGWEASYQPNYGEDPIVVAKAASLSKLDTALTEAFADWNNF